MVTNILIIIFILAMAYWWAVQGFFSAFLHLCLTIVAATMALSFWEPLVLNVLIARMPAYAWAVGLIAPFVLLLILLRIVTDKLVPMNMRFTQLIGFIGGAACGIASAILTSGLVVIAIGFLPIGPTMGMYQPYVVTTSGQIQRDQSLWVGVDDMAYSFFAMLGGGAFSPWNDTPLAIYQPDLPGQASLVRLTADAHASIVAEPKNVTVEEVFIASTPIAQISATIAMQLGEQYKIRSNQLVVIDTLWKNNTGYAGTFDTNNTTRISPTQITLITQKKVSGRLTVQLHPPIAVAKQLDPQSGRRFFAPFNNDRTIAHSLGEDKIGWVFIIPDDSQPWALLVRHLRLTLPNNNAFEREPQRLADILGQEATPKSTDTAQGDLPPVKNTGGGNTHGLSISSKLPRSFNMNGAYGLKYKTGEINSVVSGTSNIKPVKRSGPQSRTVVNEIYTPSHQASVRLEIDQQRAQEFFGASTAAATSTQGVRLEDDLGTMYYPFAYVWTDSGGTAKNVSVPGGDIKSARDIPILYEMQPGDMIYLYFRVRRDRKAIVAYHLGNQTKLQVMLPIPKQ